MRTISMVMSQYLFHATIIMMKCKETRIDLCKYLMKKILCSCFGRITSYPVDFGSWRASSPSWDWNWGRSIRRKLRWRLLVLGIVLKLNDNDVQTKMPSTVLQKTNPCLHYASPSHETRPNPNFRHLLLSSRSIMLQ